MKDDKPDSKWVSNFLGVRLDLRVTLAMAPIAIILGWLTAECTSAEDDTGVASATAGDETID